MLLDGKYHEAAKFAHDEWHKNPTNAAGGGFGGGLAFSMHLDFPKTKSVKDYLRTVDFESTEVKVHWTDERGEWVRRTFTSRPDNVVVQWLDRAKRSVAKCPHYATKGRGRNVRRDGRLRRRAASEGPWRGSVGTRGGAGVAFGWRGSAQRTRRVPPGLQRAAADLQGHS